MSRAFPEELKSLARAKADAQAAFEAASDAWRAAASDIDDKLAKTIAREVAMNLSIEADRAFEVALKAYMASQRVSA